jgi:hypothetical protein
VRVDVGRAPDGRMAPTGLFGTWRVGSADRQRAVVTAVEEAWRTRPWPSSELGAYGVLIGDDDDTLLHVSLAEQPDAASGQDLSWKRDLDAAVPGIDRAGVVVCRRHRSTPAFGDIGYARCVVLVTREFDSPDVARAQDLVDTLFASSADTPPADGLIGAHFYVSLDGAQVFNYALWVSAEAHERMIDHRPAQLEGNPDWQKVHAWPGLRSTAFQRFRPGLLMRP